MTTIVRNVTATGAGSDTALFLWCRWSSLRVRYPIYRYPYLLIIPENVVKVECCYQDPSDVTPMVSKWCHQETSKISVRYKHIWAERGAFIHIICLFSIQKIFASRCRKTRHRLSLKFCVTIGKCADCNSAHTVLEWLLQFVKFELISILKLSRGCR